LEGIDFEEFLEIYQRMFIRCKGSVAEKAEDLVKASQPVGLHSKKVGKLLRIKCAVVPH
jgi:hypothetical protein